ncbi:hypothetical protein GCM10022267_16860 [Lentzea roselyniae]|uniref:Tail specific protease domain-containing protein n=1 Tax=Lentzea roselyniae TaxID=531940 RepID=A0ABP7AF25_9PSEU
MIRYVLLVLLLLSTGVGEPVSPARSYLDTALDLLQQHSMESSAADWPRLRAEAHRAGDAHDAIRWVIGELGNPHTVLRTSPSGGPPPSIREVPGGRMIGSTAYLKLPQTSSDNGETYVESGRYLLRDLLAARPSGWVVDLRGNHGGDMHPMLTVVAPLLGEGKTGSFVHPDGTTTDWGIRDGHVHDGERIWFPQVEMPPAVNGPVAVLIDGGTASSGEAVLLAFTGAARTRSFGEPTAGYATSNELFLLPDGARLAITTAYMADRTGRTYGNTPIAPQTLVDSDEALDAAIEWLAEQT